VGDVWQRGEVLGQRSPHEFAVRVLPWHALRERLRSREREVHEGRAGVFVGFGASDDPIGVHTALALDLDRPSLLKDVHALGQQNVGR